MISSIDFLPSRMRDLSRPIRALSPPARMQMAIFCGLPFLVVINFDC
jgi:hypothetical protein